MKVFFAADLHGKENLYEQLDGYIHDIAPAVLILGGDLFPEDKDVAKSPACQVSFAKTQLRPRFERYKNNGLNEILVIMGNHDLRPGESYVKELTREGLCRYIHNKRFDMKDGPSFVGYSFSPPSPYFLRDFDKKDSVADVLNDLCRLPDNRGYISENGQIKEIVNTEYLDSIPPIVEDLQSLAEKAEPGNYILICHAPPASQYLDCETKTLHVGSQAIRNMIVKTRPLVSFHGHIHFSPKNSGRFSEEIEGVPCIQPGQRFSDLYGVSLDLNDPKRTLKHTVLKGIDA